MNVAPPLATDVTKRLFITPCRERARINSSRAPLESRVIIPLPRGFRQKSDAFHAKTKVATGKFADRATREERERERERNVGEERKKDERGGGKSRKRKKEKKGEYGRRRKRGKRANEKEREIRRRTQLSTEQLATSSPLSSIEDTLRLSPCPRTCSLSPADRPCSLARIYVTLSHTQARARVQKSRSHPPTARRVAPHLADPRSAGVFPPSPCFRGPFQPPRSTPCPAGHVPIHRRHTIVRSIASRSDLAAR